MSIVTKTGDTGKTGLMYNRRVSKCHPRVEAYGAVDELNAALGLARSQAKAGELNSRVELIQADLIHLMGELATDNADVDRYREDGFKTLSASETRRMEDHIAALETRLGPAKGWATPGVNPLAAHLDMARAVCRRTERRVCALMDANLLPNNEILVYLNRLADLLWLMARAAEVDPG